MKEVFTSPDGRRSICVITTEDVNTKHLLQMVTIERKTDGSWKVVRSRAGGGETFIASDLADAFAIVFAAYDALGMPRSLLVSGQTGASATADAPGTFVDNAPELARLTSPLSLEDEDSANAQCGAVDPGGEVHCSLPLGHDGEHAHESWNWADAPSPKTRAKRTSKRRAKGKRRGASKAR